MSNDLISRQAAIDAVHEEFDEVLVWDESGRYTADEVENILDRLPPVEPKYISMEQIQEIIDYLDSRLHPVVSPDHWDLYSELYDMVQLLGK